MAIPLAAKAAVILLKDKRVRNIILSIIVGVIATVVLITMALLSILTAPTQWIDDMFSGPGRDTALFLRGQYGLEQFLDDTESGYMESDGLDFSGVVFTDSDVPVVYFNQLDAQWKDIPYGDGTIGRSGCGPTSLSMVISSLTGQVVTPAAAASWAERNGYKCPGNGSYHSLIPDGAIHYGLSAEGISASEPQKIIDALTDGKLVIGIFGPGHFTKNGHFLVLRGVTADGKILIADPASRSRSEQEWDMSIILDEARKNAGAGGPFWAIGAT